MRKGFIFAALLWGCLAVLSGQDLSGGETSSGGLRSFGGLYAPAQPPADPAIFSSGGISSITHIGSSGGREALQFLPRTETLLSAAVFDRNPSFVIETLRVVPWEGRRADVPDVYRAATGMSTLKDEALRAFRRDGVASRKGEPVFLETGFIPDLSAKAWIPDPAPPDTVPPDSTFFIKLKDADFGDSYYRADFLRMADGLLCTIANAKQLTVGIIPVIRKGNSVMEIYVEPLEEGLFVYSVSTVIVPDFIFSLTDIPGPAVARLNVIIQWLVNGSMK